MSINAEQLRITRHWCMPNRWTFSMRPLASLIERYMIGCPGVWIDPYSGKSPFAGRCITNDLMAGLGADYCLESLEFMDKLRAEGIRASGILFDPPYTRRQIQECYAGVGIPFTNRESQSFWRERKDAAAALIQPGGVAITCGYNTEGMGKRRGFRLVEVLMLSHGANHNDTLVTVEVKAGVGG